MGNHELFGFGAPKRPEIWSPETRGDPRPLKAARELQMTVWNPGVPNAKAPRRYAQSVNPESIRSLNPKHGTPINPLNPETHEIPQL